MKKLQAPSSKLQRSSKYQARKRDVNSLAIYAREDEVEFFRFAIQSAGFVGLAGLSSSDKAKEVFRFLRFFYASSDRVAKVLLRNALIRFTIIRSDTRAAADKLTN